MHDRPSRNPNQHRRNPAAAVPSSVHGFDDKEGRFQGQHCNASRSGMESAIDTPTLQSGALDGSEEIDSQEIDGQKINEQANIDRAER
ncbi:MAG: hypothetical protein ABIO52_10575 [Gemmatimonadaceae bacterium]